MATDHAMAIIQQEQADHLANMARLRAQRLEREQIEAAEKAKAEKAASAKERKAAASKAARLRTEEAATPVIETAKAVRTKGEKRSMDEGKDRENRKKRVTKPITKRKPSSRRN